MWFPIPWVKGGVRNAKEFRHTRMKNKSFYLIFVKILLEEIKKKLCWNNVGGKKIKNAGNPVFFSCQRQFQLIGVSVDHRILYTLKNKRIRLYLKRRNKYALIFGLRLLFTLTWSVLICMNWWSVNRDNYFGLTDTASRLKPRWLFVTLQQLLPLCVYVGRVHCQITLAIIYLKS